MECDGEELFGSALGLSGAAILEYLDQPAIGAFPGIIAKQGKYLRLEEAGAANSPHRGTAAVRAIHAPASRRRCPWRSDAMHDPSLRPYA